MSEGRGEDETYIPVEWRRGCFEGHCTESDRSERQH